MRKKFLAFGIAVFIVISVVTGIQVAKAQVEGGGISLSLSFDQLVELIGLFKPSADVEGLGAQPGPDSFNDVECHNGICRGFARQNIIATSTALCYLSNPLSATSTVVSIGFNVTSNPWGAAQRFDISTTTDTNVSARNNSTTSPAFVSSGTILSSNYTSVVWTPRVIATTTAGYLVGKVFTEDTHSQLNGSNPFVIQANEAIVVRVATATPGTILTGAALVGTCSAEFKGLY